MDIIEQLSNTLGAALLAKKWTITTAESCTGGGVSQAITDVKGSSQWFSHGYVTYSNHAKGQLLGVPASLIEEYGAVSQQVVEAMATGALMGSQADISIAVSGIAGPDGGSPDKPVGTVWIAWATKNRVSSQCCLFSGDRKSIRNQSVKASIENAIKLLVNNTV